MEQKIENTGPILSEAEIERMGMGEAVDEDDGGIVEA